MDKEIQNAPRVRLGDYIERSMVNNSDLKYNAELIRGVNSSHKFCESKANTIGINLRPYKIVNDGDFVYNPSRLNLGSIAYRTEGMCIVSHLYVVFHLNENGKSRIVPEYLFLFFCRDEFYNLITYLNFGSQRPEFNFYDMSEIQIPLPSIEVQRELVAVYDGLQKIVAENEAHIPQLEAACQGFLVDLKSKYPMTELGNYIEECDTRNNDGALTLDDVKGIATSKVFIDTKANMDGVSLSSYKTVATREFAYVSDTSRRGDKMALAFNSENRGLLISSIYSVFRSTNENILLPEYLYLYFCRPEFDRYSRFNSWGSARETFDFSEMKRVKIPLPPIEIQHSIAAVSHCLEEARRIVRDTRELMKNLCPALVQKAAHSA